MSAQSEVLNAVIALINGCQPYAAVHIGALPADNGLSIAVGAGGLTRHMDRRAAVELDLVFNGKHAKQQTVVDTLTALHEYLGGLNDYPQAAAFEITSIDSLALPHYIGRDAEQWMYGSSLRVKYYLRG